MKANIALYYKLFSLDDFKRVILEKAEHTELIITARLCSTGID